MPIGFKGAGSPWFELKEEDVCINVITDLIVVSVPIILSESVPVVLHR
jgi:hypothetical protein